MLKKKRETYFTCTSLTFEKFRKYFWLYSCVGKETKLYSCMGRYACLKDMFFVLKYFLPQKVKMHHNVRQNNLSVDRYDDLWIGCWSLKRQYNFGGDFDLHHLNLYKERQKSWASHLSIEQGLKWIGRAQTVCRYLLPPLLAWLSM